MATSSHDRSHACISQARDGCFGDLSDEAFGQNGAIQVKSSQLDVLFDEFSIQNISSQYRKTLQAKALDDVLILIDQRQVALMSIGDVSGGQQFELVAFCLCQLSQHAGEGMHNRRARNC